MEFWQGGVVVNLLILAGLLGVASILRRRIGPLRRLGIPDSMVAGALGLILGPTAFKVLPLDGEQLEWLVYHGLAIVFIAVSLQKPAQGKKGGGARSVAFMIPTIAVLQGLIGLLVVLGFSLFRGPVHPGAGLLLPLGFQQGPGQALSMGQAWEAGGLTDGSDLGLIIAAMGFAWAVFIGIPLVVIGRKRGWHKTGGTTDVELVVERPPIPKVGPGAVEVLTTQLIAIGAVYLLTFAIVHAGSVALEGKEQFQSMIWGFHFIIGALVALGFRGLLTRTKVETPLHDGLLGRISGVAVDFVTCGALAAVRLDVFRSNLALILVLTTVGGVATVFACLWLARRAFPDDTFTHAVTMFGAVTGTLPTGLALLRILDPDLKSSAPANAVLGSAGSLVLSVPLLLVVLPVPIGGWPDNFWGATGTGVAICVVYLAVLIVGWRFLGPLRFKKPLARIWPDE